MPCKRKRPGQQYACERAATCPEPFSQFPCTPHPHPGYRETDFYCCRIKRNVRCVRVEEPETVEGASE
jgi:hypothetical protein